MSLAMVSGLTRTRMSARVDSRRIFVIAFAASAALHGN
jgi:hypothetical protein